VCVDRLLFVSSSKLPCLPTVFDICWPRVYHSSPPSPSSQTQPKHRLLPAMSVANYTRIFRAYETATMDAAQEFDHLYDHICLQIPLLTLGKLFRPIRKKQKTLRMCIVLILDRVVEIHASQHKYDTVIKPLVKAEKKLLLRPTEALRKLVRGYKKDLRELDVETIAEGNRWMRRFLEKCKDAWPRDYADFVWSFD
jgi:hypothetical protein